MFYLSILLPFLFGFIGFDRDIIRSVTYTADRLIEAKRASQKTFRLPKTSRVTVHGNVFEKNNLLSVEKSSFFIDQFYPGLG